MTEPTAMNHCLKGPWLVSFYFFLFFAPSPMLSQTFPLSEISVIQGGRELANPFIGGLKAAQFNTADLNQDGTMDLVIFEREGNLVIPLIADQDQKGQWDFDPLYREIFPPVKNWLLMRDYDGDGIKDIFCSPATSPVPGIEVWKGRIDNGELSYDLILFPERDFDILYVPVGNGFTQIFVSIVDLPDIKDIDGDGDLDILAFEPSGTSVYFYRNMQKERSLPEEALEFIVEDFCFGQFLESGFSQDIILSDDSLSCASFFADPDNPIAQIRHAGSTVTARDITGNGLYDLLLGDIAYNGLVFLENNGTVEKAWMSKQSPVFPLAPSIPVGIEIFNAAFFEDLTEDEGVEMIVAPNDRTSGQNIEHIWLYSQTNDPAAYELKTRNFLIEDMVLIGDNSSPVFMDYNADGLTDILIGSSGFSFDGIIRLPSLVIYENTGTKESPVFEFAESDYLGMSQFRSTSRHFYPAVGDLDGDGDLDLVIGDDTGRLYYAENMSDQATVMDFKPVVYNSFNIKVSAWSRPEIFDFNKDGLGDLIIGEQNFNSFEGKKGSLNYFENIGAIGAPDFLSDVEIAPNNPLFGQVFSKVPGFINNFSAPRIIESAEETMLLVGTESGKIFRYQQITTMSADSFELVSESFGNIYEGRLSAFSASDIDDDGLLELAVGNKRGGLGIFETDIAVERVVATVDADLKYGLEVFPNPVGSGFLQVRMKEGQCSECRLEIYNMDGRKVKSIFSEFETSEAIDIGSLPNAVYILKISAPDFFLSRRFVKV